MESEAEMQSCPANDPVGPRHDPMAYRWDKERRLMVLDEYYHEWAKANNWPITRK
jgi:hypothetical protein